MFCLPFFCKPSRSLNSDDHTVIQSPIDDAESILRDKTHWRRGEAVGFDAYFYRRSEVPLEVPHCLQVDPLVQVSPILQLGTPLTLDLPHDPLDNEQVLMGRISGFLVGVVDVTLHHVTFAMIGVWGRELQVIYLLALRCRVNSKRLPEFITQEDGIHRWAFISPSEYKSLVAPFLRFSVTPDKAWDIFCRKWMPLLNRLDDRRVTNLNLYRMNTAISVGSVVRSLLILYVLLESLTSFTNRTQLLEVSLS